MEQVIRNKKGQFVIGTYPQSPFKKGHKILLGKRWKVKDTSRMRHPAWNKGRPWDEETKDKISKKLRGRKAHPMSEENKREVSKRFQGDKNPNWKGGITPWRVKIWHSLEYKKWRKTVFTRDNYTCVWCGEKGGILNADHIKPFSVFADLRFVAENGRTLCKSCHLKTDTYGKRP